MRIVIDMGHTPTSPGTSGYLDELKEDRELGRRVIEELERRGHTVIDSTAPDNMPYPEEVDYRVGFCNSLDDIDLICSIHLNAGGGTGTEVLYWYGDDSGKKVAKRISDNLSAALGLLDRGAKANDWVGIICKTNWTAVLIEVCFVDSTADAHAYWRTSWNDMVKAICDGIDGGNYESEDDMTPNEVWGYMNPNCGDTKDMRQKIYDVPEDVWGIKATDDMSMGSVLCEVYLMLEDVIERLERLEDAER